MQKQQIKNIQSESQYYSFVLATTEDKQIAEKWDHFILSVDGRLLMNTDEPKATTNRYCYNIGIDTFACQFQEILGPKFVLCESKWLQKCLKSDEIGRLKSMGVLKYEGLTVANSINFYYYAVNISNNTSRSPVHPLPDTTNKFIKIKPKFLLFCDCLVFEIAAPCAPNGPSNDKHQSQQLSQVIKFKDIGKTGSKLLLSSKQVYSFKSQYALLSDIHFLNCFVRGSKNIASYVKKGEGFEFVVNDEIRKQLKKLYMQAKL